MANDYASILNAAGASNSGTSDVSSASYLKSIDESLKALLKSGGKFSQAQASQEFGDINAMFKNKASMKRAYKSAQEQFTEAVRNTLLESVLGSDFKSNVKSALNDFAKSLGVELADIPGALGKEFGKQILDSAKQNPIGKMLTTKMQDFVQGSLSKASSAYKSGVAEYLSKNAEAMSGAAAAGMSGVTAASQAAGGAIAGLKSVVCAFSSEIVIAAAAVAAVTVAYSNLKPAIEGTKKLIEGIKVAGNRYYASREKQLELATKRALADMESVITEPFKILRSAAEAVYNAWDQNVRLINATQGYSKADLQNLMGAYASRLRAEGLSNVVSGVDVTQSLAGVLKTGLSGKVAEEFAYIATKLNAAVPTQDFFSYADSYASLVATAISSGKSQAQAIDYANKQLEMFASNVLFASRQLAGGFSTGLKDAGELFRESVKVTQASRRGAPSQIGGVLASVAAITGTMAPDLASVMTGAIVKAATGGNSPEIIALRSLAGVNASNTEFLRLMATNPKKIYSTIFSNLSHMQNMAPGAYMEVAEGLASVFGIPMDAFARVDFSRLANAILNMDINTASLDENMSLLSSGETTTTAEQLKMQQINKYLIDEGLSYVMDNEVARAVQEHMWDEQLNRELIEATYAVNLQGSALEFLEGIMHTVDNIIRFITGKWMVTGLFNVGQTINERIGQTSDLMQILKRGKVGAGNALALQQLLTRRTNLHLTKSYVELLGGNSNYKLSSEIWKHGFGLFPGVSESGRYKITSGYDKSKNKILNALSVLMSVAEEPEMPNSKYRWGMVGKSASRFPSIFSKYPAEYSMLSNAVVTSTEAAKSAVQAKIDKMLSEDYIKKFIHSGKTYDEWAGSARTFGISNLSDTLKDLGYSEASVRGRFQSAQVEMAAQAETDRRKKEEDFWQNSQDYTLQIIDLFEINNTTLEDLYKKHTAFYDAWVEYFIKHSVYSSSYNHATVTSVQQRERKQSQDAVYALADALTKNTVDLLDPTVQTNALLAQILQVANAILQQGNMSGKNLSLPDTLSALAMGLTG